MVIIKLQINQDIIKPRRKPIPIPQPGIKFCFDKNKAKEFLIKNYSWKDYGGKHYESIFTRFFHEDYILNKFNYDLRKAYFSAEICSGKITRDYAIKQLQEKSDESSILQNREYVFKKLGIPIEDYHNIIKSKNKSYLDYKNDESVWKRYATLIGKFRDYITKL